MISVIIPAYNSAATIIDSLESVAAQTLPAGAEVIVVDDCSTDDTVATVDEWIKKFEQKERKEREGLGFAAEGGDQKSSLFPSFPSVQTPIPPAGVPRFTLHVLPQNKGPASARNAGIAAAKGDWIAFLDADDIWLPNKMELQMRLAAEHPEVVLWCGKTIGFQGEANQLLSCSVAELSSESPSGHSSATQQPNNLTTASLRELTLEDLALRNPIATSTVLVKREAVLASGGFDEQFRGPEDYDLWIRIAALGKKEEKRDFTTNLGNVGNPEKRVEQKLTKIAKEENVPRISRAASTPPEKCAEHPSVKNENLAGCGESAKHSRSGLPALSVPKGSFSPIPRRGCGNFGSGTPEQNTRNIFFSSLLWISSFPELVVKIFSSCASCPSVRNSSNCIVHVAVPVSCYRQRAGSLSMDDRKFLPQVMRVLDKAYGKGGALEGYRRFRHRAVAREYLSAGRMALDRGARGQAVIHLARAWLWYPLVGGWRQPAIWYRFLLGGEGKQAASGRRARRNGLTS